MKRGIIFDWIGTLSAGSKGGLYPYTIKVLRALKPKYKLALMSLAGRGIERRYQDLVETGVLEYFDSVVIDVDKTPENFIKCMEEMGVTPENTHVVGDRTVREIKIGNALGCKTYWIQKGDYANETPNTETGKPTMIINSIEDLLDIL